MGIMLHKVIKHNHTRTPRFYSKGSQTIWSRKFVISPLSKDGRSWIFYESLICTVWNFTGFQKIRSFANWNFANMLGVKGVQQRTKFTRLLPSHHRCTGVHIFGDAKIFAQIW